MPQAASDFTNTPAASATPIEGTILFDGDAAARGYELNAMCYSFNEAANREAFLVDEEAYCARFHLTPAQRKVVAERDVLGMLEEGGNIYYLAKLAGIFRLNVQDVGALQTGLSVEAFKRKLIDTGLVAEACKATHAAIGAAMGATGQAASTREAARG